jgi:AcrR family transcriptional regulator
MKGPTNLSSFTPKQRIMAAALKLFVEQGYFNTNVPDLSRESQCSVGSIYHNFKNKEEIAKAVYIEAMGSFRSALYASVKDKKDIESVVKTLVKAFLEFSEVNHQLSKYIWLCRHNEFMTGLIRHPTVVGLDPLGRLLTKRIKQGFKEKRILPVKAHVIWTIIFGIPLGYVRDWFDGYNPKKPKEVADQLADCCWRALKVGD